MSGANIQSDLSYVRNALRKSERGSGPVAIYWLWAAIILVGFPLTDFAPRYVGIFWAVMGPLGGVISAWLGWRHSLRLGQVSRDVGIRHAFHWAGMLVAIFSSVTLAVTGAVAWSAMHRLILLIISLSYFLAGVHLDRPLLPIGILMLVAYFALFFIKAYAWTIVGVVVAGGLITAAAIGGRRRDDAQQ